MKDPQYDKSSHFDSFWKFSIFYLRIAIFRPYWRFLLYILCFFFSESYFRFFRIIQNDLKIGGFQPYLLFFCFFGFLFHTEAVHYSLAGLYYFVIAFYSKSAKSTLKLYDIILRTKYPSKS